MNFQVLPFCYKGAGITDVPHCIWLFTGNGPQAVRFEWQGLLAAELSCQPYLVINSLHLKKNLGLER